MMLLRQSSETLRLACFRLSPFSSSAAAVLTREELPYVDPFAPLEYLEGFPRPDPKHAELILAVPREKSGSNMSSKERKVGRVPSIVFEQANGQEGGNKRLISVQTKQIRKLVDHLGAYLNTIKRTVKYLCPADIIPPYIDVDLSELDVGEKLLMKDLKVHPSLKLLQSPDQPICNIIGSRASEQQPKKSKSAPAKGGKSGEARK